ncbi:MAG: tetraacyldisaccharide 4'-kinase [Betaproteobacteria bacterium]|nr:tetraacyldisaccharide 4'-kinase [Betaproteobacteria bacterium]MDE2123157.1 tetraacyldisaccharide 4'-kinase [Betaproteobacteria bacterium]MDE2187932.1 tetraacyldisaccharide 4'-kinase [Betaproteobacteria bacterium]MDE2323594.1 tetraacyldisaccharide 4'-kinase [Betaproteobacteria bacterium]
MPPQPSARTAGQAASGWPAWWLRRRWQAWLLLPLSGLFGALAALRRLAYQHGWRRSWRAPLPVIVVGNVTVGGTGKTPLVLAIAQHLSRSGWKPGIVSRGHGRKNMGPDPLQVEPDADPATTGDEPLLLRRFAACPVWVGRRRVAAAQALLRAHPEVDVLLSDDGLQHLALARDVELVVTDLRGPGNGWLLPAGPLRESWNRPRDATLGPALRVTSQASLSLAAPGFVLHRKLGLVRQLATGEQLSLDAFLLRHAGQTLAAAAGIGHPEQFFDMLRSTGVSLGITLALSDHHSFEADPFRQIEAAALLITEKDALKCKPSFPRLDRLWAVELLLEVDPAFFPWLLARLAARPDHPHGFTPA